MLEPSATLRTRANKPTAHRLPCAGLPVHRPAVPSARLQGPDPERREFSQAGAAGRDDDSGPFPCPVIAGPVSFTLCVNEARSAN